MSGISHSYRIILTALTQLGPNLCPTPIFLVLPASISFFASSKVGLVLPGAFQHTISTSSRLSAYSNDDRFHWEYRPPMKVLRRFWTNQYQASITDKLRRLTDMALLSGLAPSSSAVPLIIREPMTHDFQSCARDTHLSCRCFSECAAWLDFLLS